MRHNKKRKPVVVTSVFIFSIAVLVFIVPTFLRAKRTTARNTCVNNLRQIDGVKSQWAVENKKTDADIPTREDVSAYLKSNIFPKCPNGGIYVIGKVGEDPKCSIGGYEHRLPPP